MKTAAFAIGWLLAAAPAFAADPVPDAPPAGPPVAIAVPVVQTQVLANGLRIVVAARPGLPLVTAQLVVLAGSAADPPARRGLAALTAALLARGAQRDGQPVDAATLARQAESLGASLETATDWRSSRLGMTVTTPRLPAALALLADLARQPLLAADELERERARAIDALRLALDSPGSLAGMAAARAWWGASIYGARASAASLGRIAAADLRAFHGAHWRPDRALLVLAGDVDAAGARSLARAAFGDWRRPDTPLPALPPGAPAAAGLPATIWVDLPGSGQSAVNLSAPAAALGSAEEVVGEVAQALLGGGYSARLNRIVRIEHGLSYGAFGAGDLQPAGGRWVGQAQTQHASAAEVAALMREAVLGVARDPLAAGELAARQGALVGSFARQLETTAGIASLIADELAAGRDPAALSGRVAAIRAVTPAQVSDYAARWWTPASLRVLIAGDWAAAGRSVGAGPDEVLRLPADRLDLDRPDLGRR